MSTSSGSLDSTHHAASASSIWQSVLSNPWGVTWRSALVKAPRLVPMQVLRYTCPEGPYPIYYTLKSRDLEGRGRTIPVFIWVPPPQVKNRKRRDKDKRKVERGDGKATEYVEMETEVLKDEEDVTPPTAPYPVVIDFHGGSFVLGSCLEQAPFCAQLCRDLGAVVISVDYRMGPVDKFPAAVHDGEDVLNAVMDPQGDAGKALRETILKRLVEDQKKVKQERKEAAEKEKNKGQQKRPPLSRTTASSTVSLTSPDLLDTTRIAISGFSAGGCLAHNLCLDIKPPDLPERWPSLFSPKHSTRIPLLLYYPVFDARLLPSQRTRPANVPASSSLMTYVDEILAPMYLPRDQAGHPRASPGIADVKQSLHPMTKTFLVLPELDTLGEQSDAWIKAVEEAGREQDLEVKRYPGMKHGWTQFPVSWLNEQEKKARKDAINGAIRFVRDAWKT